MKQSHQISALLKSRAPRVASLLSRSYSILKFQQNKRLVDQASESWKAPDVKAENAVTSETILGSDIRTMVEQGQIVVVRNVLDSAGVSADVAAVFEETYAVPFANLDQVHADQPALQIAKRTDSLKGADGVLDAELKILHALFRDEPALYAELMPNLRPHLPFEEVQRHEAEIEAMLGRGKLNAHGPHKDSWRFHPRNTVNVWVALTDVSDLNGMFVLPESRDYYPEFAENEIVPGCDTYPARQYLTDLRAGDCLVFSAELMHGSILNQTDRTRFAFSMRCTFEPPDFHRDFMYNYVQVLPEFSNLTKLKLRPQSDFDPPSRDRHSASFGPDDEQLQVLSSSKGKILVSDGERELQFPRRCPHKGIDLIDARLEGDCLVCPQHQLRVPAAKIT